MPATSQEDEVLLAMAESDLEDKVLWSSPIPCPFSNHPPSRPLSLPWPEPTRCQWVIDDASLCFTLIVAQLNEIRKTNSHLIIIGKPTGDTKEEYDAEVEDDDADNVEESDGDDFDQETG